MLASATTALPLHPSRLLRSTSTSTGVATATTENISTPTTSSTPPLYRHPTAARRRPAAGAYSHPPGRFGAIPILPAANNTHCRRPDADKHACSADPQLLTQSAPDSYRSTLQCRSDSGSQPTDTAVLRVLPTNTVVPPAPTLIPLATVPPLPDPTNTTITLPTALPQVTVPPLPIDTPAADPTHTPRPTREPKPTEPPDDDDDDDGGDPRPTVPLPTQVPLPTHVPLPTQIRLP